MKKEMSYLTQLFTETQTMTNHLSSNVRLMRRPIPPELASLIEEHNERIKDIFRGYQLLVKPIDSGLFKNLAYRLKSISINAQASHRIVVGAFKEWGRKYKDTISPMARVGWYISIKFCLSWVHECDEYIKGDNYESLDKYLCDLYEEWFDQLSVDFIERYPKRGIILREAFDAHERGSYSLSTPVFLSQAEGIYFELYGKRLYSKKSKKRALNSNSDKNRGDSILDTLLRESFQKEGVVEQSYNPKNPLEYNRHSIIHGDSKGYGNKINSTKAMSLLMFVGDSLPEIVNS